MPPVAAPLDPDAPLAPLPGIGVDWPDLSNAPTAAPSKGVTDIAAERRYGWRIEGIAAAGPLLRDRFDDLSTLAENDGRPANAAQLDRRAQEDAELLTNLLRGEGYYDAAVQTRIEDGERPVVVLDAEPGALYRFTGVTIEGLAATDGKADALRSAFGVKPGDPVNADTIVAGQAALTTTIGKEGFPFASVGQPEIVVDHATRTATLDLSVKPGGERRFGQIVTQPGNRVFGADHVQEIARFEPGKPYDASALDDLRRALIQTGLVSSVDVKPIEGSRAGTVDVAVKMTPAPPRTVAGALGYGTGEGARCGDQLDPPQSFPARRRADAEERSRYARAARLGRLSPQQFPRPRPGADRTGGGRQRQPRRLSGKDVFAVGVAGAADEISFSKRPGPGHWAPNCWHRTSAT